MSKIIIFLFISSIISLKAQSLLYLDSLSGASKQDSFISKELDLRLDTHHISPLRASLYSAILPGMGQIANKQYIKAPIVLAGLLISWYFIQDFNSQFMTYRTAYLHALNGQAHQYSYFQGIEPRTLANFADVRKRSRDYAIVIGILIYLLNVMDAAVDAHLFPFKKDSDLAIHPIWEANPLCWDKSPQNFGISLSLNF